MDPADYVLATFRPDEFDAVNAAIDEAADLIVAFVQMKLPAAT
jgi:peptidyl-tRNA hydrolase